MQTLQLLPEKIHLLVVWQPSYLIYANFTASPQRKVSIGESHGDLLNQIQLGVQLKRSAGPPIKDIHGEGTNLLNIVSLTLYVTNQNLNFASA